MDASFIVESFRRRYLQELWRRLGLQAGERPVAIFGAGVPADWLAPGPGESWQGPRRALIVDPERGAARELHGLPVRHPEAADPAEFAAVVVCGGAGEARLTAAAMAWIARAPPTSRPELVRPFAGLLAEPLPPAGPKPFTLPEDHFPIAPGAFVARRWPPPPRAPGAGLPLPPADLRAAYARDDASYLASGKAVAELISGMASAAGLPPASCKRILDWGCSTGRVLRHFEDLAANGAEAWGCDVDAAAIEWASGALAPPFRFFTTTFQPHLALPDASFDLVYAISVFTHVSDLWDTWLMELRRILRPGGLAFVSVHDEDTWRRCASEPALFLAANSPLLDFTRPLVEDFVTHGRDVRCQTFWRRDALRRRWSFAFDVVEMRPLAVDAMQTAVLLRRP